MDPYNSVDEWAKAGPRDLRSEHDAHKALKELRDERDQGQEADQEGEV